VANVIVASIAIVSSFQRRESVRANTAFESPVPQMSSLRLLLFPVT
jgi:hypothetical protein